jgi:hypothetical protein
MNARWPNASPGTAWQYVLDDTALANSPSNQGVIFRWVDQASQNSGMTLAPADAALRAQLKLPEDQGLIVTAIEPGSPAASVGILQNDILIRVGNDPPAASFPVGKPEDLERALKTLGERPITIDLLRGGQKVTAKVQPRLHASFGTVQPVPPPFWIGVTVSPVEPALRAQLRLAEKQGLIVMEVDKNGPAARAGVRQFDILRKFDGVELVDQGELTKLVQTRADKTVALELLREGKPQEIKIAPERRLSAFNFMMNPNTGVNWDVLYTGSAPPFNLPGGIVFGQGGDWVLDTGFSPAATGGAGANAGDKAKTQPDGDASVAKRLDDLSVQLKELRQAVEALAKAQEKK